MDENLPPSIQLPPVSPRLGLTIILLISLIGVFSAVGWIYRRVHQTLGLPIAEVVVSFLAILILALILVGARLGFTTTNALRKQHHRAAQIYHLFQKSKTFQDFWFYLGLEAQKHCATPASEQSGRTGTPATVSETSITVPVSAPDGDLSWLEDLEEEITKRGRTPEHPIHRWARAVYAWERRDLWNNPMTLDEFLCSQFGENVDGSPKVSRKSFYDWRKKVHKAAKQYQVAKKNAELQGDIIDERKQFSG